MILLLTGGSGCGKSTYAERIIEALPKKNRVYIATMQVFDEESVRRVERHRAQRAHMDFVTLECPKDLGSAKIAAGSTVLLEDLPNLLANEMFDGGMPERILPQLTALCRSCENLVIVTNDVHSDGMRYEGPTLRYQRLLAELNCGAAALADSVAEVVYSIPVYLKGGSPCGF